MGIAVDSVFELLEGDFPYQVTGILTPSHRVTVYDYSDYSWDEAMARDWSQTNSPRIGTPLGTTGSTSI